MRTIGLDLGTTTTSAAALDLSENKQLAARTEPGAGALASDRPWEQLRDPDAMAEQARRILDSLLDEFGPVNAIGLTGQMHGMAYLDAEGRAASPLFTWRDGRGDLPGASGKSLARELSDATGHALATGYGLVTHAWNLRSDAVPASARGMATIDTYVGMRLTGRRSSLLHASEAASLGFFRPEDRVFDLPALERAGIFPEILPEVTARSAFIGEYRGIPVTVGIGDNQASFLGSVPDRENCVLVNVGTGGQVSAAADRPFRAEGVEARPFLEGSYLLAGSALCSGKAYALLESFVRACAALAGTEPGSLYEPLNALAAACADHPLRVDTRFRGTRSDPSLRGSIVSLGEENFTPGHFARGVLEGMAEELHALYLAMAPGLGPRRELVLSGNAVRRNPALRQILAERFGMEARLPDMAEEAASGAAIFAGIALDRAEDMERTR